MLLPRPSTMKISLHSDLHNEHLSYTIMPYAPNADVIVFAGDVTDGKQAPDYYREVASVNPDAKILFINGNHEFYGHEVSDIISQNREAFANNDQVHFLENSFIEIQGVEFIGATLWSDFSLAQDTDHISRIENGIADFYQIQHGSDKIRAIDGMRRMFHESFEFIKTRLNESKAKKKVVITHFSPHPELGHVDFVGSPLTPYFLSDCSELFNLKPDLWLYGHTHCNEFSGKRINGVKVASNQGGYEGENTGYDADNIIEV